MDIDDKRLSQYRGYEIHVALIASAKDMFEAWFKIVGPMKLPGVSVLGKLVKVHGGPYSRRWAYLVGELAGRAAIDVILGGDD
ncbi:hypothetical protein [Cupriavidus sp. DF5525]|uniref:hypothetical protein n=1 Tax=Cupriavidus sp. DF5525 TaxID=3160989 RepID=UPI0032E00876